MKLLRKILMLCVSFQGNRDYVVCLVRCCNFNILVIASLWRDSLLQLNLPGILICTNALIKNIICSLYYHYMLAVIKEYCNLKEMKPISHGHNLCKLFLFLCFYYNDKDKQNQVKRWGKYMRTEHKWKFMNHCETEYFYLALP